jgi:hypothetical protein
MIVMPKKLVLDIDNEIWKQVLHYKINHNFKTNNQAVIELIKKGLLEKST